LIENVGNSDIQFKDGDYSITCKAGEVTRIESQHFRIEGLISPDVVSGKSAFNSEVSDVCKKD
jgi:hypothetical protein